MVIDETLDVDDVSVAEEQLGRVYKRARFTASATPFRFRQQVFGDERAAFARFEIGGVAEIDVEFGDVLGVGTVQGGEYRVRSNGDEVDVARPFLLRPGRHRSRSAELDLMMLNLDVGALARFLGGPDAGPRTVQFPGTAPVSELHEQQWTRAVGFAASQLHGPALRNDLLRASVVDVLLAIAAECFPIDQTPGTERGSLPASVRRAIRFMEDAPEKPLTADDIADAAGMTARGLQAAFRRTLDTTPHAYLRTVRLAAAHDELLTATSGDGRTITAVAARWGFTNRGRFTAAYREEYGGSPRRTLER